MKVTPKKQTVPRLTLATRGMAYISAVIIALMPFHAFLSIRAASLIGVEYYTVVRLWKEVVLTMLSAGIIYLFVTQPRLRAAFRRERLTGLIGIYMLLLLIGGLVTYNLDGVSAKAMAYGLLLDIRYLVFFVITWTITRYDDLLVRAWKRLILIPAAVVVGFATLQYSVLPADFLKYFGYGPETIAPSATVDQKAAYQRVQSTLRGANPFGAYLVLVLSAVGALLLSTGRSARTSQLKLAVLYVLSLLALFFTFSRSAWIGAAASTGLLIWLSLRSARTRQGLVIAGCAGLLAFAAAGYGLRDNNQFQNVFFHTNEDSLAAESSNSQRLRAMTTGLEDIVQTPLGSGTGTAGPASVYNDLGETRISENYYVQVGQEAGIVGMALFIAINVLVGLRLWQKRQNQLALVLLVSLVGISLVNMLSHAWTDDTLAYVWWGLAGAAIALPGAAVGRAAAKPGENHEAVD